MCCFLHRFMATIALGRLNFIILDNFFKVLNTVTHGVPLQWDLMDLLSAFVI